MRNYSFHAIEGKNVISDHCLITLLFCAMAIQERTLDEHRRLVGRIMKRDQKRRKKIEAAGLDYECPEFVRAFIIFLLLILD
jgi:hypothetical protein